MVAKRAGAILFAVGMGTAALGLISLSVSEYLLFNRPTRSTFGVDFTFYQHFSDAAIFLVAIGVLLVGIAWAWMQSARSTQPGGPGRARTRMGIALALCGTLVFVAWALVFSLGSEYNLAGGGLYLPNWFTTGEGLFAGVGLALWGAGWFVVRWNVA